VEEFSTDGTLNADSLPEVFYREVILILNRTNAGLHGTLPFKTEISGLVNEGTNIIEIKVTNQWINRLISDQKAPIGKKVLNSQVMTWSKNPVESRLLDPIAILKSSE